MRDLLRLALDLYFYAIFARIILSWIPMSYGHPLTRLQNALGAIIEPVLRPIRKVMPPIRLGVAAVDLSPLILLFAIRVIRGFV